MNIKKIKTVICMGVNVKSPTQREHKLWVCGNRILKGTVEPNVKKIAGDWRKLHYEELYNLYSFQNNIWIIK
jgi:hypothetical protein